MPISFPEPPPAILEATGLDRDAAGAGATVVSADDIGGAPGVTVLPPQPVFTAGLEAVSRFDEPEAAAADLQSWRVTHFDAAGGAAAMEVRGDGADQPLLAVGDDRFSAAIQDALRIAAEDPRVVDRLFEARLFRVPGISLLSLWLHADDAPDLFVPLQGVAAEDPAHRLYDRDEFFDLVRTAANEQLTTYESAERPDELGS